MSCVNTEPCDHIIVDAMKQYYTALLLRSLQRIAPQAVGLSETACSKLEQRAFLGALHAATTARPGHEHTSSRGGNLFKWLSSGIIASRCSCRHAVAAFRLTLWL